MKRRRQELPLRLGLAILIGSAVARFPMYGYESKLYDLRFRIQGSRDPLTGLMLIGFDDRSLKSLGAPFPPPPSLLSGLVNIAASRHPRAIVLTFPPATAYPDKNELQTFVDGIEAFDVPLIVADTPEGYSPKVLTEPVSLRFESMIQGLTRDRTSFAQDGVSRRLVTHFNDIPSFEYQMAQLLKPDLQLHGVTLDDDFPGLTMREVLINYDGPAQTYPILSLTDVMTGQVPLPDLSHAVVFIGRSDFVDNEHARFSPFESARQNMSKIETIANSISSLVRENTLARTPQWVNIAVAIAAALITSFITMGSSPARGVLFLLSFVLGTFAISQALFSGFHLALHTMQPIVAIFGTYYAYIPYRLIVEYRKRAHYQQKHQNLKQVEELKTNFISLMSHDIKTPLSKIHGLAEAGLRQLPTPNGELTETFQSIIHSTEDLSRFVTTILDLSKIESGTAKIQRVSKDINAIVSDCLRETAFVASSKGIEVKAELEPLFSVPMDPALIRQAIYNLIDNALKFAPSGSTIIVKTREIADAVEFSVEDAGPGIAPEDQERVFHKFYRPNQALNGHTPGWGLGLYLVKYFVELHQGFVSVSSRPGHGSTFRFTLPLSPSVPGTVSVLEGRA